MIAVVLGLAIAAVPFLLICGAMAILKLKEMQEKEERDDNDR